MKEKSRKSDFSRNNKFYHQKFRQEWKRDPLLKDWLCEDEEKIRAYCRFCNCKLISKYCDLTAHAKTRKHLRASALHEGIEYSDMDDTSQTLKENKQSLKGISSFTIEHVKPEDSFEVNKMKKTSVEPVTPTKSEYALDDPETLIEFNIPTDDIEDVLDEISEHELKSKNNGATISERLQVERVQAEIEYFRQKALYFSKLTENCNVQRTLMILQSRKLHLEVKQLHKAINDEY